MDKRTALYDMHIALGGKMVSFAGYELPIQYGSGVISEHMAVRERVGIFDVSHMGEIILEGNDALANLNNICTNDFTNMSPGRVRYSPICNRKGGVVDDILVYKYSDIKYLCVVNASNKQKDYEWFKENIFGEVKLLDRSDDISQIALQGPKSINVLEKLTDANKIPMKYYSFLEWVDVAGMPCMISRTGYTGSEGYEIYARNEHVRHVWKQLISCGEEFGLIPCGLGARDTLRLEASMPLYGHEMNDTINPCEAGLDFAVKLEKTDFIGKKSIENSLPISRVRVGLDIVGKGIARENCDIYNGEVKVGVVTSGTHCPYLNKPMAMGIVNIDVSHIGQKLEVDVRGRRVGAVVYKMPFYKK